MCYFSEYLLKFAAAAAAVLFAVSLPRIFRSIYACSRFGFPFLISCMVLFRLLSLDCSSFLLLWLNCCYLSLQFSDGYILTKF